MPLRVKELIFIFKKGKPKFYKTKGLYEDVKIPSINTGCFNIESLSKYISELWLMIENKKESSRINTGKRKQDGVFYTPIPITKYIIEQSVGKLCEQKKSELQLLDEQLSWY